MKETSESLEAYSFTLYPLKVKGEYVEKALEAAFKNDVSVYDASYIAQAVIKGTCMYTANEKLVKKLKKGYLKCVKNTKETPAS